MQVLLMTAAVLTVAVEEVAKLAVKAVKLIAESVWYFLEVPPYPWEARA